MQTAVVATDQVPSRVSWGAILSGGLVAVAVGASFNILGAAIGSSTIDPLVQGETPDAGSFAIAAAIWLMLSNILGLGCGGYVAARLSGTADSTDGALHGLSVWAIAFLVSAVLLGNAVATTASGVGSMVQGIASSAGSAVGSAADAAAPQVDPQALVQRLQASLQSGGDPAQMTADQRGAEITRLVTRRATDGTLSREDTERMTALTAAQFGITQEEAAQRMQQLEAQATQLAQQAEQTARQAADTAAKSAAIGAYWVFATLLIGAAAAVIGAQIGIRKTSLLSSRTRRVA